MTIHLARAANVAGGQLDVLGLGWDVIGPGPLPSHVLIVSVRAPGSRDERPLTIRFELRRASGEPVVLGDDETAQPVQVSAEVALPSSSAVPEGLRRRAISIVEIAAGMALEPGLYEWVVSVDDDTEPGWRRRFYVRAKADEYRSGTAD